MAPARIADDEVYDYIVAGGGTSGCVVAGRLAENPNVSVLIIEAGPDSADLESVQMVGGWINNVDTETDWRLTTVSMPGVGGRKINAYRGRFLGGSSGMNGTLCIRGTKQDYDDWGLDGWSGEEVFRYMAKAETFHGKSWFNAKKDSHGYTGPLHTEPHDLAPISMKVMESYEDLGMPFHDDMFTTGEASHGCGHAPRTVHQGVRTTGADFVTKTYRRDNITIRTECVVDKVLLESVDGDLLAVGVDMVAKDGTRSTARVRKEVIVSGGSYCSPTILMRSGIGHKSELEKIGIECKVNLPGVGKNLSDHLIAFMFYEVKEPGLTSDHFVYHGDSFKSTYALWKEKHEGFLSTFPFGAFAYARLDERLATVPLWQNAPREEGRDPMGLAPHQPNIEFFHTECYGGPKHYADFPIDDKHTFAMCPELFSPRSRGTVSLQSSDPLELPVIDHNYLSDPLDMLVLTEACRFANEIVMTGKGTRDIVKGSWPADLTHHKHTSREDWTEYVKEHAGTCYHPAGTCKMGKPYDGLAVLDEQLNVRGVRGLRVADVSVMPTLNMGHTQMPAYAIGEKAADLIKAADAALSKTS
ncbi:GMC oxidoreductase [Viridothelium virens]|uniref:GMC oxidoreductase n=1 Tax=Viridothelium virens TaxID=1048519 RepID=A0A6A6GSL5_VIRVR|nr:GMC oxidoreductase [Viridothelium virens]